MASRLIHCKSVLQLGQKYSQYDDKSHFRLSPTARITKENAAKFLREIRISSSSSHHVLSPSLILKLMCYDCAHHSAGIYAVAVFNEWSKGGQCPYGYRDCASRAARFSESAQLWLNARFNGNNPPVSLPADQLLRLVLIELGIIK